jgi:hypothetical protein
MNKYVVLDLYTKQIVSTHKTKQAAFLKALKENKKFGKPRYYDAFYKALPKN